MTYLHALLVFVFYFLFPIFLVCAAGYEYDANAEVPCTICPTGTYSAGAGATECIACGDGDDHTTSSGAGASLATECGEFIYKREKEIIEQERETEKEGDRGSKKEEIVFADNSRHLS